MESGIWEICNGNTVFFLIFEAMEQLIKYRDCRYLGDSCHQVISSYGIDYVG